jgi:hypothetical protein
VVEWLNNEATNRQSQTFFTSTCILSFRVADLDVLNFVKLPKIC